MLSFMNINDCSNEQESTLETVLKENRIKAVVVYNDQFLSSTNTCEEACNLQKILDNNNENVSTCVDSTSSETYECSNESTRTASFEECECAFEEEPVKLVKKEPDIELTLAILKPEVFSSRLEIERRIRKEAFHILQTRCLQLTTEQVAEFYRDSYGTKNFVCNVKHITSGPIIVMVLAKHNAIEDWKHVIGPESIKEARAYHPDSLRAKYGIDDVKNAIHGSLNQENAKKEIHFFFQDYIIEPIPDTRNIELHLWKSVNPILSQGIIQCCMSRPSDPILWLANWLIANNPNKPKLVMDLTLEQHCVSS